MKRLFPIFLLFYLGACRSDEQRLFGPTYVDSTGVVLSSSKRPENVERAQMIVVVERIHPESARAPVDSCGSKKLGLTAEITMIDGRHFVFAGYGDDPCDAGVPADSITLRLERRPDDSVDLPVGTISNIRLRSTKPLTASSIEWQSWEEGL